MRNSILEFLIVLYKGGEIMVELDQYKYELSGFMGPLEELRDSL